MLLKLVGVVPENMAAVQPLKVVPEVVNSITYAAPGTKEVTALLLLSAQSRYGMQASGHTEARAQYDNNALDQCRDDYEVQMLANIMLDVAIKTRRTPAKTHEPVILAENGPAEVTNVPWLGTVAPLSHAVYPCNMRTDYRVAFPARCASWCR